jgi:hypothetical protein
MHRENWPEPCGGRRLWSWSADQTPLLMPLYRLALVDWQSERQGPAGSRFCWPTHQLGHCGHWRGLTAGRLTLVLLCPWPELTRAEKDKGCF